MTIKQSNARLNGHFWLGDRNEDYPDRPLACEAIVERPDMVNHPPHYTAGGIECIDAIAAALGPVGFASYLRGQIVKYTWRLGLKGDASEDAGKAAWYADKLRAHMDALP